MFSSKPFLMVAASVLLAAASMDAFAGHRLNHSAQFCNKTGSDGTFVAHWQGTISNSSTTKTLRLLCPVVRMAGLGTTGDAHVHVIDRNQGDSVRCSFYNQRAYGHTWVWSGWKSTLGSGPENYKTFTFAAQPSQDSWGGFHHFYCSLPPKDSTYGASVLASYSSGTND
jgi:hypothetical protein